MNKAQSETIIYDLAQVPQIVEKLRALLPSCAVITFTGPLGAGKTTLIRELLHRLGVNKPITSPTFTYMNIYINSEGSRFYHFDLYRIGSMDEFCQSGFDEYLYQPNSWVFIEWPEVIMPLLSHDVCHVRLEYAHDKRIIKFF